LACWSITHKGEIWGVILLLKNSSEFKNIIPMPVKSFFVVTLEYFDSANRLDEKMFDNCGP